jgi:hypothetical protein
MDPRPIITHIGMPCTESKDKLKTRKNLLNRYYGDHLRKEVLTVLELQHALAIEVGKPKPDEENLPDIEDIVSTCAGLVVVDEGSNIIRLVHYTTPEYFERTWNSWFSNAQSDITVACVTYLSYHDFGTGFCLTDKESRHD